CVSSTDLTPPHPRLYGSSASRAVENTPLSLPVAQAPYERGENAVARGVLKGEVYGLVEGYGLAFGPFCGEALVSQSGANRVEVVVTAEADGRRHGGIQFSAPCRRGPQQEGGALSISLRAPGSRQSFDAEGDADSMSQFARDKHGLFECLTGRR